MNGEGKTACDVSKTRDVQRLLEAAHRVERQDQERRLLTAAKEGRVEDIQELASGVLLHLLVVIYKYRLGYVVKKTKCGASDATILFIHPARYHDPALCHRQCRISGTVTEISETITWCEGV